MHLRATELLQHFQGRDGLRNIQRLAQALSQIERLTGKDVSQQVFGINHAQYIIQRAITDRESRIPALANLNKIFLQGRLQIKPDNLVARSHHRARPLIAHP